MQTNLFRIPWITTLILAGLTLTGPGAARAQTTPDDPFRDLLFPPEMVMQNQQALGLSEEQKNAFKSELQQAQTRFTDQQWKLQSEMERLVGLIKQPNIDERQTLAQLENVLAAERDIKRTQVTLLIRIRNLLRPEQQEQLRQLKKQPGK